MTPGPGKHTAPLHDHCNGDGAVVTATKLDQPVPVATRRERSHCHAPRFRLTCLDKALSCRIECVAYPDTYALFGILIRVSVGLIVSWRHPGTALLCAFRGGQVASGSSG